jgi:hypothetical protein
MQAPERAKLPAPLTSAVVLGPVSADVAALPGLAPVVSAVVLVTAPVAFAVAACSSPVALVVVPGSTHAGVGWAGKCAPSCSAASFCFSSYKDVLTSS